MVDEVAPTDGISHGTCHKIVSDDLSISHLTHYSILHILMQDQHNNHISICGDLINSTEKDGTLLNQIITGDETWCFLYDWQMKQKLVT
jgi:hypothetical protein